MPGIAHNISHCVAMSYAMAFLLGFVTRAFVTRFVTHREGGMVGSRRYNRLHLGRPVVVRPQVLPNLLIKSGNVITISPDGLETSLERLQTDLDYPIVVSGCRERNIRWNTKKP